MQIHRIVAKLEGVGHDGKYTIEAETFTLLVGLVDGKIADGQWFGSIDFPHRYVQFELTDAGSRMRSAVCEWTTVELANRVLAKGMKFWVTPRESAGFVYEITSIHRY